MVDDPCGILLVDKPEGVTSHDVVALVRKRGRFRKVGHAGTLDPMATGLLVLLIGPATHAAGTFLQDVKSYEAVMRLGFSTETGDREGHPVQHGSYRSLTEQTVQAVFKTLEGPLAQVPPMYSALKKNGRKLYELARKGISVEREPREVVIHTLELRAFRPPDVSFFLVCSKGTYVRSLAEAIGERLGCPGHLVSLRRVHSGAFSISETIPFEVIRRGTRDALLPYLRPLPTAGAATP
ncbi:MAG: tRNA pseudouridine(55) synthase TruB [Candidatus Omnitrophota bacterium]